MRRLALVCSASEPAAQDTAATATPTHSAASWVGVRSTMTETNTSATSQGEMIRDHLLTTRNLVA